MKTKILLSVLALSAVIYGLSIHNLVNITSDLAEENNEQMQSISNYDVTIKQLNAEIDTLNTKISDLPK